MYQGGGDCLLLSSTVQATVPLSLEISGEKYDTLNMSTICHATTSHDRCSLEFSLHHVFSDAGPRKHQCPGFNWVANAETSVALCKQVSVLPFFVHSVSLNMDMDMISSSKDSGVCPFTYLWVPNELRFSGCQIQLFDKFMFVTYILQLCCPYWMDLDVRLHHAM